jgi:hypothetical protein
MAISQTINPMVNVPSISNLATFEANVDYTLNTGLQTRANEMNTWATQANALTVENNALTAQNYALAAALTLNSTNDTSITSNTIGTGSKTFTVSASKSFVVGMWLLIADTAAPAVNSMFAQVTSYSGSTLVVSVPNNGVFGSGTKTAWTISLTAAPNQSSNVQYNDIVNGDFRIAQAGASFAAPASDAYDLDGWQNGKLGSSAVLTIAQTSGSTTGRLARQVTITTADAAVAAGKVVVDATKIEGYNVEKYVGNTFTVAFRAKVPVSGIHCVSLRNSGFDRSYVKEINFPTANTWQDCSFAVTGGLPTAGTWNYTNGTGLLISFSHLCGTTFQTTPDAWQTGNFSGTANQVNDCATVSNVWALEKVTLNLGTVAAVSEISVEQEMIRCQRYYRTGTLYFEGHVSGGAQAIGGTNSQLTGGMRATPTMTFPTFTNLQNSAVGASRVVTSLEFMRYALSIAAGQVTAYETWTASARL